MLPLTGQTIPYTELPAAEPDSQLFTEWETYRREVGRLLAEGQEGRFVLIKGDEILGLYDTREAVRGAGLQRYQLQPFLVHQVRSREPLIKTPIWFQLWHASRTRSRQTV
jgi:hypothetical protein